MIVSDPGKVLRRQVYKFACTAFQRDMKRLCGKNWLCRRAVDLYFVSVRVGGKSFFKAATPPWCLASCAKDLGDPNGSR